MVANTKMDLHRAWSCQAMLVTGTRGLLVRSLLEDDVAPVPYSRHLARYPWPRAANAHTLSLTAVISLVTKHIRMVSGAVHVLIVALPCCGPPSVTATAIAQRGFSSQTEYAKHSSLSVSRLKYHP